MTSTETHTCTCTACNGLTFTAPTGYVVSKTKKGLAALVHNYAQAAHTTGGIHRVMADRAGIVAVAA